MGGNKEKLAACFKTLCLSGIRDYYKELNHVAEQETMRYEDYLLELLLRECEVRYNNRIARLLRASKLPLEKNLENFDMKRLPPKLQHQAKALLDGSFVDRKENILAFGNPGSGKTHLLCAIGLALVQKNRRALYTTCALLVQELLIAKRDLELERLLKKLARNTHNEYHREKYYYRRKCRSSYGVGDLACAHDGSSFIVFKQFVIITN